MCPKSAATQVIIHRIEFQESEREIIRDLAMAYQFNKVVNPIVALINDNTTMLLILTAIAGYLGFTYIPPKLEEGLNLLQDWEAQYNDAVAAGGIIRERVELVGDAASRGPLWGLIDMAEALFGVNLPDFGTGYEPGPDRTSEPASFGGVSAAERAQAGY
ncbi:MAG TPA: hypothetical protein EYN66_19415 [Myxococcales bacterium]|nr:hypothetical protein [Myxococcales bacterium]